ncbi:HAD family acid phosphatase [Streptomyces sp. NPDC051776]|uniref:HAD family acid phosphatase n=1 Tax=Streptomyces sp. NPDC051776 TaxID=3155414 RepID=UPI003417613F
MPCGKPPGNPAAIRDAALAYEMYADSIDRFWSTADTRAGEAFSGLTPVQQRIDGSPVFQTNTVSLAQTWTGNAANRAAGNLSETRVQLNDYTRRLREYAKQLAQYADELAKAQQCRIWDVLSWVLLIIFTVVEIIVGFFISAVISKLLEMVVLGVSRIVFTASFRAGSRLALSSAARAGFGAGTRMPTTLAGAGGRASLRVPQALRSAMSGTRHLDPGGFVRGRNWHPLRNLLHQETDVPGAGQKGLGSVWDITEAEAEQVEEQALRGWQRGTKLSLKPLTSGGSYLIKDALGVPGFGDLARLIREGPSGGSDAPGYDTWRRDLVPVVAEARTYIDQRTRVPTQQKFAIVLDIDNTSLETHYNPSHPVPAIPEMRDLAAFARSRGVDVMFVTHRPAEANALTLHNLLHEGYPVDGLYNPHVRELGTPKGELKLGKRLEIENLGYTIIANIGNTPTDFQGGHAERQYKLPDYDGKLS